VYKIICHLNCRKVPSLNLSRESPVCLTSPILTGHKSAKFAKKYAMPLRIAHNLAVHDVLLINK